MVNEADRSHSNDSLQGVEANLWIARTVRINITKKLMFCLAVQHTEEVLVPSLNPCRRCLLNDAEVYHVSKYAQDPQESRAQESIGEEPRSHSTERRRCWGPDSQLDFGWNGLGIPFQIKHRFSHQARGSLNIGTYYLERSEWYYVKADEKSYVMMAENIEEERMLSSVIPPRMSTIRLSPVR